MVVEASALTKRACMQLVWRLLSESSVVSRGVFRSVLSLAEVQEYDAGLYSSPARREGSHFPKEDFFL